MNKKNIDEVVEKFQQNGHNRKEMIDELSEIIIRIPGYMNCYDYDIKSEFYLLVLSKIDKLISSYRKIDNCSFETWFVHILKRQFIQFNFRKNYYLQKQDSSSSCEIENDKYIYDNFFNKESSSSYFENGTDLNLSSLNNIELKVVELKFGFDIDTCYTEEMKNKRIRKNEIEIKLNNTYNRLIDVRNDIQQTYNNELQSKLKEKEASILRRKRNNEKKYNRILSTPSNKWVSEQLNISEGTVASYLTRIRKKLKTIYSDRTSYFDS